MQKTKKFLEKLEEEKKQRQDLIQELKQKIENKKEEKKKEALDKIMVESERYRQLREQKYKEQIEKRQEERKLMQMEYIKNLKALKEKDEPYYLKLQKQYEEGILAEQEEEKKKRIEDWLEQKVKPLNFQLIKKHQKSYDKRKNQYEKELAQQREEELERIREATQEYFSQDFVKQSMKRIRSLKEIDKSIEQAKQFDQEKRKESLERFVNKVQQEFKPRPSSEKSMELQSIITKIKATPQPLKRKTKPQFIIDSLNHTENKHSEAGEGQNQGQQQNQFSNIKIKKKPQSTSLLMKEFIEKKPVKVPIIKDYLKELRQISGQKSGHRTFCQAADPEYLMKWASVDILQLSKYDQVRITKERSSILEEKAKLRGLKAKFSRGITMEGVPKRHQMLPEEEADNYMLAAIHTKLNLIDRL